MSESVGNILNELVRATTRQYDQFDRNNERLLSNSELLKTLVEKVSELGDQVSELTKAQSDSKEEIKYLREKLNVASSALVEQNKNFHEREQTCVNMMKSMMEKVEPEQPKKKTKVPKEPKIECSEMTAKGNKCTKPCIPGETCCTLHMKMREKRACLPVPKEPKKKRPILKKKKKEVPVHNHKPGELPTETCELCETHGDIFDPDMPNSEFEESQDDGDISIEEKLRKMLDEEEN